LEKGITKKKEAKNAKVLVLGGKIGKEETRVESDEKEKVKRKITRQFTG